MFGLLKSLFGSKPKRKSHARPATAKQFSYARKLGIAIPSKPTLHGMSALIEAAERANPKLRKEREEAKNKKRVDQFGAELVAQEQRWDQLADQRKWMAAVYKSGKSIKHDVLSISGASINDKGKLKIDVEVGKTVKDRDLGGLVETGRYFELDSANLLWSQVVDDFDVEEFARFQQTLALAAKMAKKYGG